MTGPPFPTLTGLAPYLDGIPVVQSDLDRAAKMLNPIAGISRCYNVGDQAIQRWNGTAWVNDILFGAASTGGGGSSGGGGGGGGTTPPPPPTVAGYPTVLNTAARNALGATGIPAGYIVYNLFTGNLEGFDGGAPTNWQTVFDATSGVLNPFQFGATATGAPVYLTTADINAHPEWIGTYTVANTWDYVALQEMTYAAFGPPSAPNSSGNPQKNRPCHVRRGAYVIDTPWTLYRVMGAHIFGDDMFATKITTLATTPAYTLGSCLQINGIAYSTIEHIDFEQSSGVPNPLGAVVSTDWDGTTAGGWEQGFQGVKYLYCAFSGNGQYPSTDPTYPNQMHAAALAFHASYTSQGSESQYIGCHGFWGEYGLRVHSFNALQVNVYGGNWENCRIRGIGFDYGSGAIVGVGFQNGFNGQQIAYGGYDIEFANSADDASVVLNCRTESLVFLNSDQMTHVIGCNMQSSLSAWIASHTYAAGTYVAGTDGAPWIVTAGGISGTAQPNWSAAFPTGTVNDGGVVWSRVNYAAVTGANVILESSIIKFGQFAGQRALWNFFSRQDPYAFGSGIGSSTAILAMIGNQVTIGGGPDDGQPQSAYGINANGSKFHDPHWVSPDGAFLLMQRQLLLGAYYDLGICTGDFARPIMGVIGVIGKRTPYNLDLATSPADTGGLDQVMAGGLSSGVGTPGRVRLQTGSKSLAGTGTVADPTDQLIVDSLNGISLGRSGAYIRNHYTEPLPIAAQTIASGGDTSATSLTFSFYGVNLGDKVEAALSVALPATIRISAQVISSDTVRLDLSNSAGSGYSLPACTVQLIVFARPPLSGITPQSATSDSNQLAADLGGGSANYKAYYDGRVNVTATGSAVSAWDDIAGALGGKGPTLSLIGSGTPVQTDGTKLYQPSGNATTGLISAASAQLDVSGTCTILFICTLPVDNRSPTIFEIGDGGGVNYVKMTANQLGMSSEWRVTVNSAAGGGTVITNSPLPSNSIVRAGYISLTTTTLALTLFDFGTVSAALTGAYPSLSTNKLGVFASSAGLVSPALATMQLLAIIPSALTGTEGALYRQHAIAKHFVVTT